MKYLIALLFSGLMALPALANTPDIRVLYKKNTTVTIFEDSSVRIKLSSNQNYNGTRGYCVARAYFVYQETFYKSPEKIEAQYGNTDCRYSPSKAIQNRLCDDNHFDLQVIISDDANKYLGEAKLNFRDNCNL